MRNDQLRIISVVDAIQGRNGVGTYFQDLNGHLQTRVARAELVAPSLTDPHPCQGLALPMPGDPTQRLFLPKMRELTRLVLEVRPHVMVVPGPGIFSLGGYWLAKKLGIPVCVTFQTDYEKLVELYWGARLARFAGGMLRWLNLSMFRGAASVATISRHMVEQARQVGIANAQLVGTTLAPEFVQRPLQPMSDRVRSLLFVGRLAAEKNIDQLLRLSARRPDLNFSILGDGPLRAEVERCAARQNNVAFLGWQPRSAVVDQLDRHDMLVLPSAVEAFGTVALEAMARRRLVLTTPACGINHWPSLAAGLFTVAPGEALADSLERIDALSVCERAQVAERGRRAALAVNEEALEQWLTVLRVAAGQRNGLPRPWPSPTLALLRRLNAGSQA